MSWICVVCGYVHDGDEPPLQCPICEAPRTRFINSGDKRAETGTRAPADDGDAVEKQRTTETNTEARAALCVGDQAPDFTLPTHNEGTLNLSWYEGRKNVVLAFYPGDWTPVCSTQIPGYRQFMEIFSRSDCQLFGISVDSVPCHVAWAKSLGGLPFPLMADFYPHGAVARKYGVFTERGYSARAVFLIDKAGIIRFIENVPLADLPDNDALIAALAALEEQSG